MACRGREKGNKQLIRLLFAFVVGRLQYKEKMFAYLMILVQTRDTCPRPSGKRIWRSKIVVCQRAYNLYLRVRITPMIDSFGEVKKLKCVTYIYYVKLYIDRQGQKVLQWCTLNIVSRFALLLNIYINFKYYINIIDNICNFINRNLALLVVFNMHRSGRETH